jgi:lysophospholipase L1-like esterase
MYSILCFGDSLTYGRGEIPSKGWVGRLKENFETELIHKGVYNLGIPGETSQSLNLRIKNELKPRIWYRKNTDKYVTIIQIGLNDIKSVVSKNNNVTLIDSYMENMREIISYAKNNVDQVIVLGTLGVDETKTQPFQKNVYFSNKDILLYNEVLLSLSTEMDVSFLNFFEFFDGTEGEYYCDGIHLNQKGYNLFYDLLIKNYQF